MPIVIFLYTLNIFKKYIKCLYTNYNFNRIHCIYIPNIIENYRVIQVSVVAKFCQQFYQNQTFIFYFNFYFFF